MFVPFVIFVRFIMSTEPDPRTLKHRPVVLIDYEKHDGFYPAGRTDCRYLSLGWAQYDPRQLSVKTLRHTGDRWSRQSEELPLHRCIDAAALIAEAVGQSHGEDQFVLEKGFLERQDEPISLPFEFANDRERDDFLAKLRDPLVMRRLGKLADVLIALRKAGRL
jgi:hypothetical protein